jgi:hypothetical protein
MCKRSANTKRAQASNHKEGRQSSALSILCQVKHKKKTRQINRERQDTGLERENETNNEIKASQCFRIAHRHDRFLCERALLACLAQTRWFRPKAHSSLLENNRTQKRFMCTLWSIRVYVLCNVFVLKKRTHMHAYIYY